MTERERQWRPPPAAILRLIVDHQRWLTSNGRHGRRFAKEAVDFENCDLAGVDLSGAHLSFANFVGGTLQGARFIGAELSNAKFIGCNVDGANFAGAFLFRGTFATNHQAAKFEGAYLQEVSWSETETARRAAELNRRVAGSAARAEPR